MMSVEQSVEWVAGETEVLGENLTQCSFVHHKFHIIWPGLELGLPRWEKLIPSSQLIVAVIVLFTTAILKREKVHILYALHTDIQCLVTIIN
jgi:hypothetical protein